MQNQTEATRINKFLHLVAPIIVAQVKTLLHLAGLKVKEKGHGLDLVFSISSGEKEAEFYLQNLFLEIATVGRDEEPLRFDENLRSFDYFLAKTNNHIQHAGGTITTLFGGIQKCRQYKQKSVRDYCQRPTGFSQAHWTAG